MSIEFTCPECGKLLRTRDERAGARALCPECDREIAVPGPDLSATSAFSSSLAGAAGVGDSSRVVSPPPLPRAATSDTSANDSCTSCGAPRPEGSDYCAACGSSFHVSPPRAQGNSSADAGFWLRVVAWLIDSMIIGAAMGAVARMTFPWIEEVTPLVWWLYYALMESSEYQATVGKMALGLVVTDEQGERLSFGRATGRFFAKILSAIPLGFGFVMAGFTLRKQALHDLIAGCLVLRKS